MIGKKSVLWTLILVLWIFVQLSSAQNSTTQNTDIDQNQVVNSTSSDTEEEVATGDTGYNSEEHMHNINTTFPQSVIDFLSKREMRYHHYLWHQVRDGWLKFTPEVQQRYTELGWAPPRPSKSYDENGTQTSLIDNDSGEDFLYMHRHMIQQVNEIITKNNESFGNITGWKKLPAPGDPDWPVPAEYEVPNDTFTTNSTSRRKTDEFYNNSIAPAERTYTNPDRLRNMTLGELGSRIEFTIHGWLHMRFSSNSSYGYRPGYINRNNLPYMDPIWDNPEYNWLGDSYASHVHPIFYKIHGWVDDRIEDWRIANNLTEITWKGTWIGGPMYNMTNITLANETTTIFDGNGTGFKAKLRGATPMNMDMGTNTEGESKNIDVLEEALQLFMKSGVKESSFADEVVVPDFIPIEAAPMVMKSTSRPKQNTRRRLKRVCKSRTRR